ncbi:MAG: hypothetical protein ACLQGP_15890 [Isosphaeraceae bacterium]
MVSTQLLEQVAEAVRDYCAAKGYVRGSNWNPLTPQDSVAALAMARVLIGSGAFDHYIAVAPEGHVYGFFFERLGAPVLSILVDYPPTRVESANNLSAIRGGRVLLIEDDIVSGISLDLVMKEVARRDPSSVSLYLGRDKDSQQLQNIPAQIDRVYLAEDSLDPAGRGRYESEFLDFFQHLGR